ncbi:hypothetical protein GA830_10535 [Mesorhizobium sp. NBSH29]|uniref:hypothetical protein n=1 Tax=Mesorhizobium sp. NBSH29 TaxID=2654249 RepID=UPI001896A293|nr:hypothetical protein [Mesorhizobium sp. NBSH29]QPC87131.1 hypothetical protein GA830_10535 [Mesorhizobium sp. NBSH29]
MTNFAILTGKTLAARIAGFGKVSATYAKATHQLAYSALNHVELHHDAKYMNALFNATPANYRNALVKWAVAFGKVAFDPKAGAGFTYAKAKVSDMPGAMKISPADFVKDSTKSTAEFDEMKRLESMIKLFREKGASKKMVKALEGVQRMFTGETAAPVNVVAATTVIKARKAKAAATAPKAAKVEKVAAAA